MRKLFIVPIEPLDNRYTKQWYDFIPVQLKQEFSDYEIINIDGNSSGYEKPQPGAFFDFSATCLYKASQAEKISQLFIDKVVNEDDIFFFTDAWNQTVHTVRYISELNKIPVKCVGIWHAGYYDPTDILGFTIQNNEWISHLEKSMYYAYDQNYFGTSQHLDKFRKEYNVDRSKAFLCGYPLDYLFDIERPSFEEKENIIVFPHRLNEDKAPYVFDWLKEYVQKKRPDIKFVKTQEMNLTKEEYYCFLRRCKIVFSANKHENLGISTFEAHMLGSVVCVPDKLSYREMYPFEMRYPMTDSMYLEHNKNDWEYIGDRFIIMIDKYNQYTMRDMFASSKRIYDRYFSSREMFRFVRLL